MLLADCFHAEKERQNLRFTQRAYNVSSGINTHSLDIGIILGCITSILVLPICAFFSQYINTL